MIWIGGVQGAGKSTLAWRISRKYDLPLHRVDLWTYDHLARLPANESLDEELARGPQHAADAFLATSRRRLVLVLADVPARELGSVPALVEGPQLTPELAERLPKAHGVWVDADPARTRAARGQRLAAVPVPAERSRLERLLERDSLLGQRIRCKSQRLGLPLIAIRDAPDCGDGPGGRRGSYRPRTARCTTTHRTATDRAAPLGERRGCPSGTALETSCRPYRTSLGPRPARLWT